ncbi:MAG: hypothetical protein J5826_03985, partial [Bacteroidales bacterium]|nr:hypothetical protein [Bacteroidales bacterium]
MEKNDKYMFDAEEINSQQDFNEQKDLYSIYLQAGNIDTDKAWNNISAKLTPRKRTKVFKLWYAVTAA